MPGQTYGAGAAYAPGGPGYEFGYQPVPEPVRPAEPAQPVALAGGGPGYEFGYARDAAPPSQDDLLAPPPSGPGRPDDDGPARYGTPAGYTYAPPLTPPTGPPGSGPPGFEFPGTGRPRTGAARQPSRRPLLALPPEPVTGPAGLTVAPLTGTGPASATSLRGAVGAGSAPW